MTPEVMPERSHRATIFAMNADAPQQDAAATPKRRGGRKANPDRQLIHVRTTRSIHAELDAYAQRTHRTLNGAAEHALATFLREHGQDET